MHRIDGPGATVDHKFTDGDPVGGVQPTVVTAPWLNDMQEELMSVLAAGGVSPVKGTQDQLLKALAALIQGQGLTAFTTGGTAAALTLTPVPAIAAYAAPQRFRVKFSQNSTPTSTINVSGKGGKLLKQYDASGQKVAAVYVVDQLGDIEYDGTDFVLLDQLPSAGTIGVRGRSKNLIGSTTGLNAIASYSADEVMVGSASNNYQTLRSVNISPNLSSAGLNGLDTGVSTPSTWYNVFVVWNPTSGAVGGVFSLSENTPVLPSGFTHWARLGSIPTDSTASKFLLSVKQVDRWTFWKVVPGSNAPAYRSIASGVVGTFSLSTPTYAAVSISAFAPPTAVKVRVGINNQVSGSTAGSGCAAPNASFGGPVSANPPPIVANNGIWQFVIADLILESASIYVAQSSAVCTLFSIGWEDNL